MQNAIMSRRLKKRQQMRSDMRSAGKPSFAAPVAVGARARQSVEIEPPPGAIAPVQITRRRNWEVAGICALLVVLVFIAFAQTIGSEFVNYDDLELVYQNPQVFSGFSFQSMEWAFTHSQLGHWDPLTTLTHLLDCQCYGLWPGGHHLTNLLLHALAVVLLFLAVRNLTEALGEAHLPLRCGRCIRSAWNR